MYFRGFSGIDSPAAMHSATSSGFTVSGKFSKAAAFWVLVLFDSEDFYSHPRLKPLPDGDLTGRVLEYDVHFSGAVGYDCPKFPTIDWKYLDYIKSDGTTGKIDLSLGAGQTTITSGTHAAASTTITVNLSGTPINEVLTLWFQNFAFSYQVVTPSASDVATGLAAAVNSYSYAGNTYGLHATASGANVTITASPAGVDGNMIRLYWVSTDLAHLSIAQPSPIQLSGGSSNVTYHVKLDFSALGLTSVRQLWLTFAPLLADSADYTPMQADIVFSNWGLTSGSGALQVAGPGSVRVEETDAWATLKGSWTRTNAGWFSQGYATVSTTAGDSVTVTYWCPHVHDVWLGTYLAAGGGTFTTTVDGAAGASINTALTTTETISTRRKIASGLTAGQHTIVLTISGGNGYFDFLEAVVASDVPAAPGPWLDRKPANDFDTQHGYQLAPARLFWMMDALGFTGAAAPYYLYSGVFWLNQRAAVGRTLASLTIDFGTLPALTPGTAQIFVALGATTIGKSVFASETAAIWAMHFALFINETFSGVWASYSGSVLTIYTRDDTAAYAISSVTAYYNNGAGNVAIATSAPGLTGSVAGTWEVDPTQTPALNYAAQQWHADYFAQAAARSTPVATALSMEVVYPPGGWAQQFKSGAVVTTDTGFSNINSTQCAPMSSSFLAYQIAMFLQLAALQAAVGLTPYLTLGEFLWWFFPSLWLRPIGYVAILSYVRLGFADPHGLSVGDPIRVAELGGIPSINGSWHVVAVPDATHVDIDAPYSGGTWVAGSGVASGGSMAYYDAQTSAAALAALGRPLAAFAFPDDTPTLPDALFLANRLAAHVAAIVAAVRAAYPAATLELLLPLDVNGPSASPVSKVGGQLNHYVNIPAAWKSAATAPFDLLKIEQLAFCTTDRNMDLVKDGLAQVAALTWPASKLSYLYPVDNGGVAQWREYALAKQAGFTRLVPFALDQICLIGWRLDPPDEERAQVL